MQNTKDINYPSIRVLTNESKKSFKSREILATFAVACLGASEHAKLGVLATMLSFSTHFVYIAHQ